MTHAPLPMTDDDWLDAALDDALDAAHVAGFEARLGGDAAFRAAWERRVALRDALRARGERHALPPDVESRLLARLAEPLAEPAATSPRASASAGPATTTAPTATRRSSAWLAPASPSRRTWFAMAGSAVAASLVTAVGLRTFGPLAHGDAPAAPSGEDDAVLDAVNGHARAFLADRVVEAESSNQHTVRPWLTARLPYATVVPDLSAQGFELLGARRDLLAGRPVAVLVYRRRLHVVSAFAAPDPAARPATARTVRGFHVVTFAQGGMGWWLVSDLNPKELGDLAELLREAS